MKLFRTLTFFSVCALAMSCQKNDPNPLPVPVPQQNTLQNYFAFNGSLKDSTNNLSNPVVTGAAKYVIGHNAQSDSALYLDGTSKIVFPNLVFKGQSFTISTWVKYVNGGGGMQLFLTAMDGATGGPALMKISNSYGVAVSVPGTNSAIAENINNSWHHIAATYDGAQIKFYVDGTLSATTNHPGSVGNGARDLVLGFFSGEYWKGYLDELKIYNKALTTAEILAAGK